MKIRIFFWFFCIIKTKNNIKRMIVFAAIMPHPPESISGLGKADNFMAIEKTRSSFEKLRIAIEQADPETIVVISPHGYMEKYYFVVNSASSLIGNLMEFGSDETYIYENDLEIVDKLSFACSMSVNDMPIFLRSDFLDHGALIPLHHITKNIKPRVVHLSFSLMDYNFHYRYGEIIKKIIDESGKRVAVIASADLSHRLTMGAPAGFSPKAGKFDRDVVHFLRTNDLAALMNFDQDIVAEVAECGMRSVMILLGILHDVPYEFKLLSYEAPLGVGYLTARLL